MRHKVDILSGYPLPSLQKKPKKKNNTLSRLTPQPPLPHTPPETIPSLVGGVLHMLAEGSPQSGFHNRGLSHIPHVEASHDNRREILATVSNP